MSQEAELREFLEADAGDVEIDASFEARLREELWALLRAGTRG